MAAVRGSFSPGDIFESMSALKLEVARFFAHRKPVFRLPVNNQKQLKVVCTEHKECPFVLWAFRHGGSETVRVTRFNGNHAITHVVPGIDRERAPNRVRGSLLVPIATAVLSVADVGVKSSQIVKKARAEAMFEVGAHQAWRAKRAAIDISEGDGKKSYMYMQDLLNKMEEVNPGTAVRYEQSGGHFSRASIAHGVFDKLFEFVLPVIALDACHLKTRDKGILYVASLITGNFDVMIAGMAISNTGAGENKDDWLFFLNCLIEGMSRIVQMAELVIVSDRDKGLLPAVAEKITHAHHSFCSVHIKRNVVARYHNGLDGLAHKLPRATLPGDVEDILTGLRMAHAEIASYLEGIDKTCWITAHFPVPRFGIVTSKAAESMNSSIADERLAAHLAVFIRITRKIGSRLSTLFTAYQGAQDKDMVPRIAIVFRKTMDSAK